MVGMTHDLRCSLQALIPKKTVAGTRVVALTAGRKRKTCMSVGGIFLPSDISTKTWYVQMISPMPP